jgi:subtilisin family serine protease
MIARSCDALLVAAVLLAAALPARATVASAAPDDLVRATIGYACAAASVHELETLAGRLSGVRATKGWIRHAGREVTGWRVVLTLDDGRLTLDGMGRVGSPRQVTAQYDADGGLPLLLVEADDRCLVQTARRLQYDGATARSIEYLDGALQVSAVAMLDPPIPPADAPPILVGLIDTGVNYLLPEISAGLARDARGQLLGYDYEDLDDRPFDVPTHAALSDHHHGTQVAALLLDEAPAGRLVPYRYPHSNMIRMATLIDDAAAQGLRILNVSLAGIDRAPWLPFLEAARRHPEILLVVAAGNHGRSIDREPVYPAAFDLDNLVVVTSADAGGALSDGANWGSRVDLMVHAEGMLALGFDGERRPVSGSSYAAARVSALAACLLAAHPAWRTEQLKAALLLQAEPVEDGAVAHGFIPDAALGRRGACGKE